MKQRIDLDRIWKAVRNGVASLSKNSQSRAPMLPTKCPLSLDELLAADFDLSRAIEKMTGSIRTTSR